jgi:hypothetical protein
MSPALLSKRLKDLEAAGVVMRKRVPGEPGVFEYRLTESGRDLRPVIEAVGIWGQRWIESKASLENLDPNLLMWDMRRNIDPTRTMTEIWMGYTTVRRAKDERRLSITGDRQLEAGLGSWLSLSPLAKINKLVA